MTRVEASGGRLAVEQKSWLLPGLGILLLALAALNAIGLVVSLVQGSAKRMGDLIGPILGCGVAGVFLVLPPIRRWVVASREDGEVKVGARRVFGTSEERFPLGDVTAVAVTVGSRWEWLTLRRREGAPVRIMDRAKRWTWDTKASPELSRDAQAIAGFFGVPLEGPVQTGAP